MEVKRTYIRKGFEMATVALVAPNGKWKLDGKELPDGSVAHLMTFALQTLQDAYAGASDQAEADANFEKKYAKLVAGEIGVRGTGVDSFTKVCRSVAREMLRAKMAQAGRPYKDFTSKSAEEQNDVLDKIVNDYREVVEAEAKKRIKAQEAARELAASVDIDI